MCLLLSNECLLCNCYLQVHILYTLVVPPIGIYPDFLLATNYTMVDVPVVHIWILYYALNILLHLTKQKLEYICDVNRRVILKQMMMHINWLMDLYTYIRMLGSWVQCLLSRCVCSDYMRCMSVCESVWFSYDSSILCLNNTVTVVVFVVNVPAQ